MNNPMQLTQEKINYQICEAIWDGDGSAEAMRRNIKNNVDSLLVRQMEDYIDGAIKLAQSLQS
jgi:hypothetical protein